MSKAILVIDMPDSCKDCDIMFKGDYSDWCPWKDARTDVYDYIKNNTKPDWCPLKELPTKIEALIDDWSDGYEDKERLIRCKDCNLKHYSESGNLWCDIFDKIMPENGFCCFAEGGK